MGGGLLFVYALGIGVPFFLIGVCRHGDRRPFDSLPAMCSEDEWEKACKGPGNARWPYGNVFDANACNTEDDTGEDRVISPSGRFAKCRSGFGVADLSGNASEWTSEKVIKGGSFGRADFAVRCSARQAGTGGKSSEVGFRCCSDSK